MALLIDNPPTPDDPFARRALEDARSLPEEIERWLAPPRRRATAAQQRFRDAAWSRCVDGRKEARRLADELDEAAQWLERQIANEPVFTHTDELFVDLVFRGPAADLRAEAESVRGRTTQGGGPSFEDLRLSYRRLTARFDARLSSFERKRFENLSHQPNKAMNLNSFLGLLGASWRGDERDGLLFLVTDYEHPDFAVEAPTFVLTLDADSLLHAEYAAKLVEFAERPGNDDIAVLQTPYSAVPNAPGILERTAGATTDIQYLVHQGFGRFGAAYWVGANALIRTKALDELRTTCIERGHEITRFISDRTVIEDTESSLDLVARGWRIHNHPERLSLSATPPDFGSLVIQRRRWANGGLLLAHKLLKRARRKFVPSELFLRSHYLLSISLSNVGVVALLYGGFGAQFSSWWLPVSAAPYFALYARDLRQAGYKGRDMIAVYALNVLLVPANLAGVYKSLDQSVRRRPTPFSRTPKRLFG
ncbi:MAG: glycosyltransferase family 2 protein [Actinomycetota bacterium]|nr:glycosyltransferase family 2 protein [Actinomycetota bacterium]